MLIDPFEPNDTMSETVTAPGETLYAVLRDAADVDWYSITITQPHTGITITLSGAGEITAPLPADYDLAVFGPTLTSTDEVEGAAMFGNAMFGNAMFGNAMFGNAMFGNAMFGNAMFGNAMFGNAMFGNAMFGNAMFGNAMFGNAMFGNAMFGNSMSRATTVERVLFNCRDHVGTYYLAVWNGSPQDKKVLGQYRLTIETGQPYTLKCVPQARSLPPAAPSLYPALPEITAATDTLIVVNLPRLAQYYGAAVTATLQTQLDELAAHAHVNGAVVDVSLVPAVVTAYEQWDTNVCDVPAANRVAIAIRDALKELVGEHRATLKYLVFVGSDEIIPFYRVPDMTALWNEWEYGSTMIAGAESYINQNSATFAALEEYSSYILTDDFYADFQPLGGEIIPFERYLPDYGTGRLVETPTEIAHIIDAFLTTGGDTLEIRGAHALVFGYDFLLDGAEAIKDALETGGATVNAGHPEYISDTWTKSAMESIVNDSPDEIALSSLNGHFTHWLAQPADESAGHFPSSAVATAITGSLTGDLVFSVGCHSGLNVPDQNSDHAVAQYDFAQAFSAQGATYIANTGFGYGETDGVYYSELLMQLFAQELLSNRGDPKLNTLGEALRQAKLQYFARGTHWTSYDDKSTLEAVLYGLPMIQIQTPGMRLAAYPPRYVPPTLHAASALLSATVEITNTFATGSSAFSSGAYYHLEGEVQQQMHQPLQPRHRVDLTNHRPANWTESHLARGALLLRAQSHDVADFDPIIAKPPITDTVVVGEPSYDVPAWNPAQMLSINRANTARELLEYLLVVPAQYWGTHEAGVERLYDQLEVVVYYSTVVTDVVPPTIWEVEGTMRGGHPFFAVDVQDDLHANLSNYNNGLHRVVVTYRDGGYWRSVDLAYNSSNYRWEGAVAEMTEQVDYFVQAVDDYGNVSFYNGKGELLLADYQYIYLPVMMKNYTR